MGEDIRKHGIENGLEEEKLQRDKPEKSDKIKKKGTAGHRAARKRRRKKKTRRAVNGGRTRTAKKSGSTRTGMSGRDEERVRKREARRRKVKRQKIIIAVSSCIVVVAAIVLTIIFTPSMKLSRLLSKGEKYTASADYVQAKEVYEEALEMDDSIFMAYWNMAENAMAQGQRDEALETAYRGWEKTQDERLLNYYCTIILNEVVAEINSKEVTFSTVDKCLQVLEKAPENADAVSKAEICFERLFGENAVEPGETEELPEEIYYDFMYDANAAEHVCQYEEYGKLLLHMLAVSKTCPQDDLKKLLARYALPESAPLRISMPHLDNYVSLLTDINQTAADGEITKALACLEEAKEVQQYFAQAFEAFGAGNYEYARTLIVEERYIGIRDSFINGTSGNWKGDIYIPVNQEQLVLEKEEGTWRFYFLAYDEYENSQGVITIWGTQQADDGIQRCIVSYEPASEGGEKFPHTQYTVQYLYSNVKINGRYVPQMNYRFDTKVTDAEGTTTVAVGDWGGEHEFEIDY